MKNIEHLFEAKAASPFETATLYNGGIGFRIPDYQRQYDWQQRNIERLYYDTLNGFRRLGTSAKANAYTFLGSLILVKEQSQEPAFRGVSVAVVDGQQRLTTLALFACALIEVLRRHIHQLDFPKQLKPETQMWLTKEVDHWATSLYWCAVGTMHVTPTSTFPFPRIVRMNDARGSDHQSAEYRSPIGVFLKSFSEYFSGQHQKFEPPQPGHHAYSSRLDGNFRVTRKLLEGLNDQEWYDNTECEMFDVKWSKHRQCSGLFRLFRDFIRSEREQQRAINAVINHDSLHSLVRTVLFASYFCNCIVLTRVTTEDESTAFDIFDALNTTGQPLTALETLKPRVIKFEGSYKGYRGSDSEHSFDTIDDYVNKRFPDTTRKQRETKDLVVTFALYLNGTKLPKDLATQRDFLRQSFSDAERTDVDSARRYMQALALVSQFRRYYWDKSGIEELSRFHGPETLDEVQLLVSLIFDMKTSLALPILARFWSPSLKTDGDTNFLTALRAMVAFIVLRRGATGSTAGIDSDFRALMAPSEGRKQTFKFGLCAGKTLNNEILSLDDFRSALKSLLQRKMKAPPDKKDWVGRVVGTPLYTYAPTLARFMILAAADGSMADHTTPGTWTRRGVKRSGSNALLTYNWWRSKHYATVEHIAPDSVQKQGWNASLYKDEVTRHSPGNLILLPQAENASIGTAPWEKKKKFYQALAAKTVEEQKTRTQEANAAGITFSKNMTQLLERGDSLPLLNPICHVADWNRQVVSTRGKNIAELCWDIVWEWLD